MATQARPGWGYWVIAVISLLWNGFGGFDYVMTQMRNPDYLKQFPADIVSFIDAMPGWVTAAWAIGVWASVLGSILLLLRSGWAVPVFWLSLLGLAVSSCYQFYVGVPPSMATPAMIGMTAIIWLALIFQLWFASRSAAKGYLR